MKKALIVFAGAVFWPVTGLTITTTVPAGTVVNGGDVNSIVTQEVYGTANNFTVSGIQQVMSGGVARGSIIYNQQDVMSGGTAYDTYV